jgi:hypothetical protein
MSEREREREKGMCAGGASALQWQAGCIFTIHAGDCGYHMAGRRGEFGVQIRAESFDDETQYTAYKKGLSRRRPKKMLEIKTLLFLFMCPIWLTDVQT